MTAIALATRPTSTGGVNYRALVAQPSKSTGTAAIYAPSNQDFLKSFYAVYRRWESETAMLSSSKAKKQHVAFLALANHADMALPFILSELKRRPSHLVWVLNATQAAMPFDGEVAGDIEAMSKAWVKWGEENGRIF